MIVEQRVAARRDVPWGTRPFCEVGASNTYRVGVVGEEVDVLGLVGAQLLLPGRHRELVVDADHVDALDTLLGELGCLLNEAGNVRRAWWGEGAWDTDDDVYMSLESECYCHIHF